MSDLTQDEMKVLSDQFRQYFQTYNDADKTFLRQVLKTTFAVSDVRAVQTWTTTAATRRDFIHSRLSESDFDMRVAFAQALMNGNPPNSPQKERKFDLWPERQGTLLRQYLSLEYTRQSVTTIGFVNGRIVFTYDSYNDAYLDTEAPGVDEYYDIYEER